jgi:hypothetical protein
MGIWVDERIRKTILKSVNSKSLIVNSKEKKYKVPYPIKEGHTSSN